MIEKKSLVCIVCPLGCNVDVELNGGQIDKLAGNKCKRGRDYVISECINPVRTLTSTAKVLDGELPLVSVKSEKPLPKNLLPECIKEINKIKVQAPVRISDRLICNILGTGINIIATCNVNDKSIAKSVIS